MNRTELRYTVGQLAERARNGEGAPSRADIEEARQLFDSRKDFLSQTLGSSVKLIWCDEPDWSSWKGIANFLDKYHAALVEIDNKSSGPMAGVRLQGI